MAGTGTGTIADDDAAPTSITLTVDDDGVGEGEGATTITVTATVDGATRFADARTVRVSVSGSGTAGAVDFAPVTAFDIEIAAGAASGAGTFVLRPTDDAVDETDETVTVGGASGGLTVNPDTISLTDDDGAPTSITLTVDDDDVGEDDGATTITVTATVNGATPFAEVRMVRVSVSGSGTAGAVDFAPVTAFDVSIAAGAASGTGTFVLRPTDDAVDETDETVTVGGTSSGLTVNSDTITLTDDDATPTSITLTVDEGAVDEGDGATTITVTAAVDGATRFADDRTVRVSVSGSGTAGTVDFAPVPAFDVSIAAGAASGTGTFVLRPTDDAVDETDETVTMGGTSSGLAVNPDTISLTDDDGVPTSITLTVDDDDVGEGDGTTTITVTATVNGATPFAEVRTVRVSVSGSGTAGAVDFWAQSGFDISLAAGAASGTGTFMLRPTDDAVDETDETVTVNGTSSGLTVNSDTITLTDDDAAPSSITLTVDDDSVGEGEGDGATTITVTAAVDGTTRFADSRTVRVSVLGSGTATAVDFAAVPAFDITIAAGAASGTETFLLRPIDDAVDETDETVTVNGAASGLTVNSDTITLTDDDAAPSSITLTVDDDGVDEGDGATTIMVTATVDGARRFADSRTVRVSVSGSGTATAVDFAAVSAFDVSIAAGAASGAGTFVLTPTDDVLDETDETVTVGGTSGGLTVNPDTISLTDDDGAPTSITLTVDEGAVDEGDGATTITVTATVNGATPFAEDRTVRGSVSGSGTAGAVDFAPVSAFDVSIAAGTASGTGTFVLRPTDDAVDETDETVTVSGTSSGLTVNSDTIRLTDDDGTPTLTIDSPSVSEGDSGSKDLTFTVTLSAASGKEVTVDWAERTGGTATSRTDYTSVTGGTLAFPAGATSRTFNVSVTGDTVDEADETILVSLSDPTNATLSTATGTGTITDDDGAPTITLTVDDDGVGEGDGTTTITVTATVDGATRFAEVRTVRVSVSGSGMAGAVDFAAVSAFDIEIAAGAASGLQSFYLRPIDDAVDETDETVTVSGASGGLTVNSDTITLTDDDAAPSSITLTVDDDVVGEGDGATTITVTATVDGATSFADDRTVRVSVSGSGTSGAVDFAAVPAFDVSIAAGAASGSGTFTLRPTGDALDETDETVTVGGTSSGLTVNPDTISLTDDDGVPTSITLTVDDDVVGEVDGATTITVTATVNGATQFAEVRTVRVSVSGSGTAGAVDFAPVSAFDVSIAAGAASGTGTFVLRPTDDALDETDETVTVSGTSSGLTVNSDRIRLEDDDAAPSSITLTVHDVVVGEDDGAPTITVTATVDGATRFADARTVRVSVLGSGMVGAVDFAAVPAFDVEIAAGAARGTGTFVLRPTDDALDETDETVTVGGASSGLTVNSDTITLTDDDAAPSSITLTVDDDGVGEGDGATAITVTATVDGTTRFVDSRTVRVSVSGSGTAGAVDFAPVTAFDIEIAAGAASGAGTFVLRPTGDAVDETDETVTVSGISGSLTVNSDTISLTDDDGAPTSITLTVDDDVVGEVDGATTITVTATVNGATPFAEDRTVRVSVSGSGTATAVDFAPVSAFDVSIAAGAASGTGTFVLTPTDDAVDETDETVTVGGTSSGLTVNSDTITLTDEDAAPSSITLRATYDSIQETDEFNNIGVIATVDGATRFADSRTVRVSVSGSGTAGAVDFLAHSGFDIEIAAGAASGQRYFALRPINDRVDETDETVTVSGTSSGLTVNSDTVTLIDDDAAPSSITLTVDDDVVGENDGAPTITVTATVDGATQFADARTVRVSVSGSGTAGAVDFAPVSAFDIEIAAGAASGSDTFTLRPIDDAVYETAETVTVSGTSSGLRVNSDTVTLYDDDRDKVPRSITLTVDDDSVGEGDGATTITVTATVNGRGTARFAEAGTVRVSVSGSGTAGAVDFAPVSAFDVEIAAGAASGTGTFTLTPTDDVVDETDETVTVGGTSPRGIRVISDTISLTDDDGAPTSITLTVDDDVVGEADGATTITVTATVNGATPFAEDRTVRVNISGGYAATAVYFAQVGDFDIEIAAGAASGTGTFELTPTDDVMDETDETVTVSGASSGLTVNSDTITLTDDDAAPTSITLTVDDDVVGEVDGATTITVTAAVDGATRFADARTVRVNVSGSGTAGAVDFAAVPAFDIEIAVRAASGTGTFVLTPTDDALDETDETVTVSGALSGLTVNSDTIRLTDDDAAPTSITLTVDDDSVDESDEVNRIQVFARVDGTTRFADARTVRVNVSGSGTATAMDFAAVPAFDIEIAAGATVGTGIFWLIPTDDALDETDETVTVSGTSNGLTVNSDTITLTDNDAAPSSITLTVHDDGVGEDDGATTITVTATVDGATRFAEDRTVRVSVSGSGTATAVDFAPVTAFDIEIAAGAASGTGTFELTPTDDSVDETDETVTVSGTSGGLTVNPDTISLTDDDAAPSSITLTVGTDRYEGYNNGRKFGVEGSSTTFFVTATVDGATRFADSRTVRVSVSGSGTATAVDFAPVSAFDVSIAAGAASGTGTFVLRPTDDALDETDETVTVSGMSSGLTVSSDTITLVDDDGGPTSITLTVDDDGVFEDDGATTITVTATVNGATPFAEARTVRVSVSGSGRATAVDFAAVPVFDITIAAGAGSSTGTFVLRPTDDAVDETPEIVTVGGTSSGLTVNSAKITLVDDDAAPTSITLTVDDDDVGEGDGATTITVTATVDGARRFADSRTVRVSVSGSGRATAVDFAAVSAFDVEIAAGAGSGTGTFMLTPTDDAVDEIDETVTVGGTSSGLTVNSDTIRLTDDDGVPTSITLTVDDDVVGEDDEGATLTVTATLNGTTRFAEARTVRVSVSGSGTAGAVDFWAQSAFDVEIAAGAGSGTGTFMLTPTDDALDETDETVTVSGTSSGLTVNSDTITLTDDDAAPSSITLTVDDDDVGERDGATTLTVTATVDGATRFADSRTVRVSVSGSGTAGAVDFAPVSAFDVEIAAGAASGAGTFVLRPTDDALDETDETVTVSGTSSGLTVNSDTISLTDDDATPTITLTVDDDGVGEGDGATTLTVTATVDGATRFADSRRVRVSVSGSGTATAVDFAAVPAFDVSIAAGAASGAGTFVLRPTDDAVDETDETVTVSGISGSLTVNSDTITLTDDDAAPTSITLTVDDDGVGEGDGATTITATATVDGATRFVDSRTVRVSVSGSGTVGAVDFAPVTAFDVSIAAGAASGAGTFVLTPTDDALDETDETVTVSGISGSLTVNPDTISLTDDDGVPTSITLTVIYFDVVGEDDGATPITVMATLNGTTRFAEVRTVRVSVSGSGTAGAVDFAPVPAFDISIAAGAASNTRYFVLRPTDDALDETDETITVSGTSSGLTVNSDTIRLTDDDGEPTLSIDSWRVSEGDSGSKDLTFTVTLSTASDRQVTVSYADATTGTATSGVDYTTIAGGTLTFPAGATSQTFNVSVTGDVLDESNETILVSLSDPTNATISTATGTGTIADDDAAPTSITLTVDDDDVGEGDGATTITVTAAVDGATRFTDARTVRVSVSGSSTAGAVDFSRLVSAFPIRIAAGAASGTGTFVLRPTDDALDETDETVTVSGISGSLTVNSDTIRLTDDDGEPILSINSPSVSEGDSGSKYLTFTVTLSAVSGKEVTVDYADAGTGTATPSPNSVADYTAITGGTLTFPAGATSQSFDVSVTGDVLDESHETLRVSLSDPTNATISTATGTGTITDDDGAATSITLTVDDDNVGEGDGTTTITVTATVDGATRFADRRVVRVSVSSGTATAVDFGGGGGFDVEIAAGAASGAGTFVLTPTDDALDETDETVTVSGTSSGLTVNSDTITLTDNDAAPSLSIDSPSVREASGYYRYHNVDLTFTVTLSAASGKEVTVDYVDAGTGTATPSPNSVVDYIAITGGTLTFPAGATSQTFDVSVWSDSRDDPDETVVVTLSNAVNATIGTATGTGTITDDDAEPTLLINADHYARPHRSPSVSEGDSGSKDLTFTVWLSPASGKEVTVDYADAGTGTATSGTDYTAITSGTLTFPEGTTRREITVSVTGDTVDEADETIQVSLSDPTNATISTATDTGTITDDDGAPTITLTVDDDDVGEGDGAATITVTATVDGATRFADSRTVRVSVSGSGRATTVDFAAVSAFDIEIAAGAASGTGTFVLTPTDDVVDEIDETVIVSGTSSGLTVSSDTISLTDDDGVPTSITLTVDDDVVGEGDGATTITVTATVDGATSFANDRTVVVSVSGSGTAGAVDFSVRSAAGGGRFPIRIAAGAASGARTFMLTPTDDTLDETDETVTVSGISANLTVNSDTIRLTDDDGEPTLSIDSWRVSEGDGGSKDLTFTVVLSAASGRQVTVDYADEGTGTATSGTDYTAITSGTLTFPEGITRREITVSVTGDVLEESNETILVSLSDPTNATLSTATGTGTITDDDGAPTITLTVDDDDVGEGDGATTITVTATVDGATRFADARTVRVSVSGSGTAGAVDFAAVSDFDVEIAAGAASGAGTFTLRPTDDALDETDETVTVGGTSSGLTVNSDTIRLTDDDGAPTSITLTVDDDDVGEGDGSTTITVTATVDGATPFAEDRTVRASVSGSGTAGAVDFAPVTAFDVSIAAGATSGAGTFVLRPTDDTLDETDETVTVGGASSGLTVNSDTIRLTDDDGEPALSIDSWRVSEGDGGSKDLTFTVVLSAASGKEVTVDYADAGTGTATSGVDYTAIAGGTLIFPAGATSQSFDVSVTGDVLDESHETLRVSLSDPTNATISTATGTGTITDDDGAPTITLTVDDDDVGEGDGGHHHHRHRCGGRHHAVRRGQDGPGERVGERHGGGGGLRAGVGLRHLDCRRGGERRGDFRADADRRRCGRDRRDGDREQPVERLDGELRHDPPHGRRRGAEFDHLDGGRRRRGRGGRGHPHHGDGHVERYDDPVRRGQDGPGECVGERHGGGGGLLGAYVRRRGPLPHPDRRRGGERHGDLRAEADRRHVGRDRRDRHGERHGERPDGEFGHDPPDGRRRGADPVHRFVESERGGRRFEGLDVHGGPERGQRQAGDGGLRRRGDGDGHFGDRLHGHHQRHADLPRGHHQTGDHGVGDGRRSGGVERDDPGVAERPDERNALDGHRYGDDHGRRRGADHHADGGRRRRGRGRRRHHDHGDGHGGRRDAVRRFQDGPGERVGERDGGGGGLRGGVGLRHRDCRRGGERHGDVHADADRRRGGRDRRDRHGGRHVERPDGELRHDPPHGRRRGADLDHADGGRRCRGRGRRGHHHHGDRHGERRHAVCRGQDGAGECVGERDGGGGGLRAGDGLRRLDRRRGDERHGDLHAEADRRLGGRDRRDGHGERRVERPDGEFGHDPPDGRRRGADPVHRFVESERGGQRFEGLDVHGGPERGQRQAGDSELCRRHHGDGYIGGGLHGDRGGHADLPRGRHQPEFRCLGDGRRSGRVARDAPGVAERPDERNALDGHRDGDDHGRRRGADHHAGGGRRRRGRGRRGHHHHRHRRGGRHHAVRRGQDGSGGRVGERDGGGGGLRAGVGLRHLDHRRGGERRGDLRADADRRRVGRDRRDRHGERHFRQPDGELRHDHVD